MKPLITLLTIAVTLSCLNPSAHADRKSREEEKARQQRLERQLRDVEYILKHESDGTLSDRKAALKNMISTGVAPDEAYWQAGYIKKGDQWVSVLDPWLTSEDEQKVDEYAKERTSYADSDEGYYKFAHWCAENGYDAQAYAHLKAVLLNHPDHAGLRKLLGYQKIGNRWMNAEEFEAAVREADRLAKELREWGPQVAEIREGLNSGDRLAQNRAKTRLKKITEVAAVPALELILLPSSNIAAAACVDQLCQIDHRRSSIALCKAAMSLPESASDTKQAAIEELKTRPLQDFAPELLDELSTPMTVRVRFLTRRNASRDSTQFLLQLVGESESRLSHDFLVKNQILVAKTTRVTVGGTPPAWRSDRARPVLTGRTPEAASIDSRANLQRDLLDLLRRSEKQLESVETEKIERNRKVEELLTAVTGISSHESAEDWWGWWNQQNDYSIAQKTPFIQEVTEVAEVEEIIEVIESHSCFVAGTPVWTDRGPRPIDQLHVGDMALTKDVETGELAYRPIIRTTVRQPKELVTIDFGAEQITATKGHPFWVSGEGWVKARDLKTGQMVHTPTGVIEVDGVTPTDEAEVYNLIVDGYHTYFVGMSQALCHDISMASPTDAVVPGLLDR